MLHYVGPNKLFPLFCSDTPCLQHIQAWPLYTVSMPRDDNLNALHTLSFLLVRSATCHVKLN